MGFCGSIWYPRRDRYRDDEDRDQALRTLTAAWLELRQVAPHSAPVVVRAEVLRAGRPGLSHRGGRGWPPGPPRGRPAWCRGQAAFLRTGRRPPSACSTTTTGLAVCTDTLRDAQLGPLLLATVHGVETRPGPVAVLRDDADATVLDCGDRGDLMVFPWLADAPRARRRLHGGDRGSGVQPRGGAARALGVGGPRPSGSCRSRWPTVRAAEPSPRGPSRPNGRPAAPARPQVAALPHPAHERRRHVVEPHFLDPHHEVDVGSRRVGEPRKDHQVAAVPAVEDGGVGVVAQTATGPGRVSTPRTVASNSGPSCASRSASVHTARPASSSSRPRAASSPRGGNAARPRHHAGRPRGGPGGHRRPPRCRAGPGARPVGPRRGRPRAPVRRDLAELQPRRSERAQRLVALFRHSCTGLSSGTRSNHRNP